MRALTTTRPRLDRTRWFAAILVSTALGCSGNNNPDATALDAAAEQSAVDARVNDAGTEIAPGDAFVADSVSIDAVADVARDSAILDSADSGSRDAQAIDANGDTRDASTDAPVVDRVVPTDSGPCPGGKTGCDGRCIDPQVDEYHCGACGHACADTESCVAGVCQPGYCYASSQCVSGIDRFCSNEPGCGIPILCEDPQVRCGCGCATPCTSTSCEAGTECSASGCCVPATCAGASDCPTGMRCFLSRCLTPGMCVPPPA